MTPCILPAFATETEEAEWWYENRETHAEEFIQAFKEGRVRRGGVARHLAEAKLAANLAIDLQDARLALLLAETRGVEVQTYLAELIHKALQQELEHTAA